MPSKNDILISKIALSNKLLTKEQIDECLNLVDKYTQDNMEISFEEVALRKKYLTDVQVASLRKSVKFLETKREDTRFGELIVEKEVISKKQLAECLSLQDVAYKQGKEAPRLIDMLIKKGYATKEDLASLQEEFKQEQLRLQTTEERTRTYTKPPAQDSAKSIKQEYTPQQPKSPVQQRVLIKSQKEESYATTSEDVKPPLKADGCDFYHRTCDLDVSELGKKTIKKINIIDISGSLDAHNFPQFEEYLTSIMEDYGYYVVLNCERLEYISSAGIGIIVGSAKTAREQKGDIRLSCLPDNIAQIINVLGFSNLIRTYHHDKGAVQSFKYM